jgi:hypothetical protein
VLNPIFRTWHGHSFAGLPGAPEAAREIS